jgi:outer membrane protein
MNFLGTCLAIGLFLTPRAFCEEYALQDLYRLALERAEKIRFSEGNLAIAETGKDKATAALMPKLTAFNDYRKYSEEKYTALKVMIQPDSTRQWGVRLDQQFSLSFREFTAFSMAKNNIEKNKLDLATIKENYLLLVAQVYYDVLKAQKNLEIAASNLERLTKYRDAAEKRLRVGEVTKTVLLRAESELSGAKADQVNAENGLALAKSVLVRAIGITKEFSLKETPLQEEPVAVLLELQDKAYNERTDLQSLAIQKKMAEQQVTYTSGAFWPNLAISGVYQRAEQDPTSPTLNKESLYGGLSLNFPFFEGGLRKAEWQEAKIREKQVQLQYDDLKKSIGLEVEAVYLELLTQKESLVFFKDQLDFARENYKAIVRQFEVGLANSIDVLDANTLLVSSERKSSEAAYMVQLSELTMKQITGTFLKEVGL